MPVTCLVDSKLLSFLKLFVTRNIAPPLWPVPTHTVSFVVTPLSRVYDKPSPETDRQYGAIGIVADAPSRGVKNAHLDLRRRGKSTARGRSLVERLRHHEQKSQPIPFRATVHVGSASRENSNLPWQEIFKVVSCMYLPPAKKCQNEQGHWMPSRQMRRITPSCCFPSFSIPYHSTVPPAPYSDGAVCPGRGKHVSILRVASQPPHTVPKVPL